MISIYQLYLRESLIICYFILFFNERYYIFDIEALMQTRMYD